MPEPRTKEEWAEGALRGAMISGGIEIVNQYHARVSRAITDYARQQVEAARLDWSCPLCHCCGEKRHDGDDPCVSCKTAVEAFRERAEHALPKPPDDDSLDILVYYQECIAAIRALQ